MLELQPEEKSHVFRQEGRRSGQAAVVTAAAVSEVVDATLRAVVEVRRGKVATEDEARAAEEEAASHLVQIVEVAVTRMVDVEIEVSREVTPAVVWVSVTGQRVVVVSMLRES